MKVSVILPTYNEVENIIDLVNLVMKNMPSLWDYEIIVVDDNSPDGTYQAVLDSFKGNNAVIPILRTVDRGFAKSIRAGIEKASGDQILVMDTDLTHDPIEIPKMLHVGQVYDMVSGSRFCPGGNMESTSHYLASLLYNWVLRIILRTQIQDNLGGYFTISLQNLRCLPYDKIFYGYGEYFFRLLHYAQKSGMSIVEVGKSKSKFFTMLFSYMSAAISLMLSNRKQGS
jgi:dolichol-phosphate mannosyltransferase